MTQYRALVDVPPEIKQGDIVEFQEPLVEGYKKLFEKVGAGETSETEETDDNGNDFVTNPDRNALKARATELGINFAPNMPTDRLVELVKEAEDKAKAEADAGNGGGR